MCETFWSVVHVCYNGLKYLSIKLEYLRASCVRVKITLKHCLKLLLSKTKNYTFYTKKVMLVGLG